jgi:hypothetical protein
MWECDDKNGWTNFDISVVYCDKNLTKKQQKNSFVTIVTNLSRNCLLIADTNDIGRNNCHCVKHKFLARMSS